MGEVSKLGLRSGVEFLFESQSLTELVTRFLLAWPFLVFCFLSNRPPELNPSQARVLSPEHAMQFLASLRVSTGLTNGTAPDGPNALLEARIF